MKEKTNEILKLKNIISEIEILDRLIRQTERTEEKVRILQERSTKIIQCEEQRKNEKYKMINDTIQNKQEISHTRIHQSQAVENQK